jgi:hypothetical protein
MKTTVKKMGIIFIFIIVPLSPVFSTEANTERETILPPDSPMRMARESLITVGFSRGYFWGSSSDEYFWKNFSEGADDVKIYRTSFEISQFYYSFKDGNTVGFFMHSSFGFPNMGTVNGVQPEYTGYSGLQIGFLFGPLFRHEFNEKFALFYGAGLGYLFIKEKYHRFVFHGSVAAGGTYQRTIISVNIGAPILLRYAISDRLFLLAGCMLTYDFRGLFDLTEPPPNQAFGIYGRFRNFSMFGVRPHVSFGFRL